MIQLALTLIVVLPVGYFIFKWAYKEWQREEEKQKEKDELEHIIDDLETTGELLGVAKTKKVEQEKEID